MTRSGLMKTSALQNRDDFDAPWASAQEREFADYTSREGAQALKDKIEAYWRERGLDVMFSMQNVGFHPAIRAARYDLRSDMINGMPRQRPAAQSAAAPANDFMAEADEDIWID
ncbi:MAG: hypothetical protein AB7G05_01835 [Hyphomonadaceae bacterium]